MSKKWIASLLAVMMLFTAVSAFAEDAEALEKNNELLKFLKETDTATKDIALQIQSGDNVSDLVIRADGMNLHLVTRENGTVDGHLQFAPAAFYVDDNGAVTMLRYDTVNALLQEIVTDLNDALNEAAAQVAESLPAEQLPTDAEVEQATAEAAVLAAMAARQERADAMVIGSAAVSFAQKFNPDEILEVKEEFGTVEISVRSEAYANALAEAVDELMTNNALGELVDRQAAANGGKSFAEGQKAWMASRDSLLQLIRTMESSETIDEDGHWTSHFKIGDDASEDKALTCDAEIWVDDEAGEAEMTFSLAFTDEEPIMAYELAVSPDSFREKMTGEEKKAEVRFDFDDHRIAYGSVNIDIKDQDELDLDFGPDYLYLKGPKGGLSTSVRETWTGKTRYELVLETAEGKESSLIVDFYEDDDSLVCELKTDDMEQSLMFKLSRIDKLDMADLSAAENVTEITESDIKAELAKLLQQLLSAQPAASETK